jgi:hypothetical protein
VGWGDDVEGGTGKRKRKKQGVGVRGLIWRNGKRGDCQERTKREFTFFTS